MDIPNGKIHIIKKKPQRGKKTYYYARKMARVNGKPRVVWSLSLGTADDIVKHYSNRILDHIQFQAFSFGIPAAFLTIAENTDFFDIVNTAAPKKMINGAFTTAQYLLAMMVGRSTAPLSKAETGRMFSDTFLNLVWTPAHHLNTQNFCNHMDKLTVEAVDRITENFGKKLISMGLTPSIVLWDETNISTNIENYGEKKYPKRGFAKDKRFDKNIIGTGIALSEDEIPIYHSVYPGNENDADVFKKSIDDIVARIQSLCGCTKKLTVVIDKGNNSENNIMSLLESCHVVGSVPFEMAPDLRDIPGEEFKFIYQTNNNSAMKAYRTRRRLWDRDFVVVVIHNSRTEKKQKETWYRSKKKIDEGLSKLQEKFERRGKGKKMTVKGLTTGINQIVPKQYRSLYWWNIDGNNRKFEWEFPEKKENEFIKELGKNVIFTDAEKWDTKRIVKTYHSKHKIERAFKWLHGKLLIPIPPIYHGKDDRIRVHIFLCIMALTFMRLIRKQLKGVSVSDERLLKELRDLKVALVKDTRTDEVQLKVMEMSGIQASVFSQLGLDRYLKVI